MYGVWTKKNYMMITLTYLGQVHTTYDFDQTLKAHNSKWPILPLFPKFWIDLWLNKCLLWPKLLTITIISASQRDFGKFWLFRFFRRVQSAKFQNLTKSFCSVEIMVIVSSFHYNRHWFIFRSIQKNNNSGKMGHFELWAFKVWSK